jgi:hypothetical protein
MENKEDAETQKQNQNEMASFDDHIEYVFAKYLKR